MEKASNGQFRELIGKLLVKGSDERVATIDKTKIQNAVNLLSKSEDETVIENFIKFINNDCQMEMLLANAFIVGDIFRHRAEKGDRRLWLGDNTQNWLIKPNLKKVIPVLTDLGKLIENRLPNSMNDTSIQTLAGNPGLMNEETFLCVMYLLIFQPELGKQVLGYALQKDKVYLFHVMVDGKQVVFAVRWDEGEWNVPALVFDDGLGWIEGLLFLSFAIA
jgi:hypothetical protein